MKSPTKKTKAQEICEHYGIPISYLGKPSKKPSKAEIAETFVKFEKKLDKIVVASFEQSIGKKLKPKEKEAVLALIKSFASDHPPFRRSPFCNR